MDFAQPLSSCKLILKPFKVAVSDADLDGMLAAIKSSRMAPPTYENQQKEQNFGVTGEWMHNARDYWLNEYDWRKREEHFNSFPQFTTIVRDEQLDDFKLHFAALFSEKPNAPAVCFLHGWPGSFLEFLPSMALLKQRFKPEDLPFSVIVPSIPGFGFSQSPPLDRDFGWTDSARLMNSLVLGLGFQHGYVAQGGDIGSVIARVMASQSDSCKAVHLNFLPVSRPKGATDESHFSEMDKRGRERSQRFMTTGNAYAREQGTRPSTLGFALSSSPIAQLAWIGEKFLEWSDEDPSLETILDNVSLYWLSNTIATSFHTYRRDFGHETPGWYVKQPLGVSVHPHEILWAPKSWMATTGNLVFHREHDKGGHFAALERPESFLQDVEDFMAQVFKSSRL